MSQFNSISEDFREALIAMADKIASDMVGPPPDVTVKVAMTSPDDEIEVVGDEGSSTPDTK